jgi:hypothetical protein
MGRTAARVLAFCAGFVATFAVEAVCIFAWEWILGGNVRPIGPGWAIAPFVGGFGASTWALEWYSEYERRRELKRSSQERAQRLGPGWRGNPVKGLKPPLGMRWQIVDTWPASDNEDIPPQMDREAGPDRAES